MSSYIDDGDHPLPGGGRNYGHSWVAHTRWNLMWVYGEERGRRMAAGTDPATQADIAKWNALGRRAAA